MRMGWWRGLAAGALRPRVFAVVVPAATAVLLAAQLAAIAGDGRHAAGGIFSVRLPPGWHQVEVTSPPLDTSNPDSGRLDLAGPSGRQIAIDWTDGDIATGFLDLTMRTTAQIPLDFDGVRGTLTAILGTNVEGSTQLDVGVVDGLSHRVHGHSVGFTIMCRPGNLAEADWSWCVDLLNSWRWGPGATG